MSTTAANLDHGVWYEKFRPKALNIMVLPTDYAKAFQGYIDGAATGAMPSLLIHSHMPGTGKTTVAKIFTSTLNAEHLFVNLSLQRGIDVLRDNIIGFAQTRPMPGKSSIKIVHLDEADGATPELQRALRASIEEFSANVRFILTCNYPHMLIAPLRQRCTEYDFNFLRLDHQQEMIPKAQRLIQYVLSTMQIEFDPEAVNGLIQKLFPNLRDTYNHLQRYHASHGRIDQGILLGVAGYGDVFEAIKNCNWHQLWETMINHGIEPKSLYSPLFHSFIPTMPGPIRPALIEETEKYMHNSAFSSDQQVTFAACAMKLMRIIGTYRQQHPDAIK